MCHLGCIERPLEAYLHVRAVLDAQNAHARTRRNLSSQVDTECAEATRVRERLRQVEQVLLRPCRQRPHPHRAHAHDADYLVYVPD